MVADAGSHDPDPDTTLKKKVGSGSKHRKHMYLFGSAILVYWSDSYNYFFMLGYGFVFRLDLDPGFFFVGQI